MKSVIRHVGFSALSLAVLAGCSATTVSPEQAQVAAQSTSQTTQVALSAPPQVDQALTLNQIMANPDWMGLFAKGAYWSDDGQSIYFARQAHGAPTKTYYQQGINGT
ncbi:S9 family peptidase, partial [Shewanella sp. 0m-11]